MDREEQYTHNMIRQQMAEMIEDEPATIWREILIVLNEDTDKPVCLAQRYVRMLRSHLVQRERMLDEQCKYADDLAIRVDMLERALTPQIKEILEAVSGQDYIESEY